MVWIGACQSYLHCKGIIHNSTVCLQKPETLLHLVRSCYVKLPLILQLDWMAITSRQKKQFPEKPEGIHTTIPRPPLENSQQGEFRSAGYIFVRSIFALVPRSQVLLRCLGLLANYFLVS